MRRREFVSSLAMAGLTAGSAAAQSGKPRRVGLLTGLGEDDPATKARLAAFRAGLAALGWDEGRNLRLDIRYGAGIVPDSERLVAELLAGGAEVLAVQGPGVPAARQATRSVPIVFILGGDPVIAGWVESFAHPGGNLTGFTSEEPSFGPKWLELLKEIAPSVRRVAVIGGASYWVPTITAMAGRFAVEVVATPQPGTLQDMETAVDGFAGQPDGGLILPTNAFTAIHRKAVIALSLHHRLPLVTGNQPYPQDGGLMYYGGDIVDIYRRSASYVGRILKGAKPADLPVQQPTKFNLVINLKTAAALGLKVPQTLLAQADEVIE
ncbi:MAG: ABC transporter substrate-binding protein [Alphaproteobacteria bacterium]|nr:ABC transporter substrate-binding protein [Alphaproteobacteria bacterium]